MEENEKLRKEFGEIHEKNERIKKKNKDLVDRREASEKKIKDLKEELVQLSNKFAPASTGRQDFQRGMNEMLRLIEKRCKDSRLVDECYDLGYQIQNDVNEMQTHTQAEYEVHLQASPTHVKKRLELEGFLSPPTSGASIRSQKKLQGSFSSVGSPGVLRSAKQDKKKKVKATKSP